MNELLLGIQAITGAIHLSTIKQMPRCGGNKMVRYSLDNFRGELGQITCKRCIALAQKAVTKKVIA